MDLFVRKSHHLQKFLLSAEDLRQHNDKLVELNSSKMALQMKLDELEAAEVNIKVIHILVLGLFILPNRRTQRITNKLRFPTQYKEKRMQQEKELLHSQTTWLNEELKAKSEELLSLSRQKGNQVLELKCKLENKEEEVCIYVYISFIHNSMWRKKVLWLKNVVCRGYYFISDSISQCTHASILKYIQLSFAPNWISHPCDFQVNQLQDQIGSLKTSNEHHQKQNEDLISKLKEVWNISKNVHNIKKEKVKFWLFPSPHPHPLSLILGQGTTG